MTTPNPTDQATPFDLEEAKAWMKLNRDGEMRIKVTRSMQFLWRWNPDENTFQTCEFCGSLWTNADIDYHWGQDRQQVAEFYIHCIPSQLAL